MDAETLELLKELQPFFKEKMGEIEPSDSVALSDGTVGFVTQVKDETYVYAQWGDWPRGSYIGSRDKIAWANDNVIRVPDAISRDPERPERGLLGMCRDIACINPVKTVPEMTPEDEQIVGWKITLNPRNCVVEQVYGDTLYLALLKVLAWKTRKEAER
jgi:hypothetical protein